MIGRVPQFFSTRTNVILTSTFCSLIITLILVTSFITVPDHLHSSASSSSSSYGGNNSIKYAVIKTDFPDPCIIHWSGEWYAFATRNSRVNIQVATAPADDISRWTVLEGHDAMPQPGKWVALNQSDAQVWAPSVVSRTDNMFVLYYAALSASHPRKHCIGAAISANITGPYAAEDEPLICDFEDGGAIDPAYFHEPYTNTSYLLYKRDGNAIGTGGACMNNVFPNTPTPLNLVKLSADLLRTVADPFTLVVNGPSDGPNIESPILYYYEYRNTSAGGGGKVIPSFHLIYNSGCFHDASYRLDHIICVPATTLEACDWQACKDGHEFAKTLLQTGDTVARVRAPGGAGVSVSTQGGVGDGNVYKNFMIFHGDVNDTWWNHEEPRGKGRVRGMFVAELDYWRDEDMLRVKGLVMPKGSRSRRAERSERVT